MLELKIPRRLESPNKSRGAHWRVRHRITQEWEHDIIGLWLAMKPHERGLYRGDPITVNERRRVVVERHVPSGHNFIRDDDNLRFCVKPLLDALKRRGFIHSDSRKWLDHPTPTQHVSADGKDWTVVRIEAVSDAGDGSQQPNTGAVDPAGTSRQKGSTRA